jgi:LPPG:FO 2-phospho-L-lactate transferase
MKITALAGGVGAARLLAGLSSILPPSSLTVIVNTGDDFDWMGLRICPDLDTVVYTLAGRANPATGWGVRDDTFAMLDELSALGGPSWFRIGDRDLATHLHRTNLLRTGVPLSGATRSICIRRGVAARILPMCDSPVPTLVHTVEGDLPFQEYFVHRRCEPVVRGFSYENAGSARPAEGVLDAIDQADAVVVCPSNPFISIGPILAIPGIRDALRARTRAVMAVSPIIAGQAVKGPTAAMLAQLGHEVSAAGVAALYCDFAGVFVLDTADGGLVETVSRLGVEPRVTPVLMATDEARVDLARRLVEMLG